MTREVAIYGLYHPQLPKPPMSGGRPGAVAREVAIKSGCGALPEGFPIVLTSASGDIAHEATLFLAHACLSGGSKEHLIVAPSTAMSRAYDLRDFLSYLLARRVSFGELCSDTLYRYAATMANRISPNTKEIYSHLTIARRVGTAVEFCVWLGERGIYPPNKLGAVQGLRRDLGRISGRPFSHHRTRARGRSTLLPTTIKLHEPRILSEKEARALLQELRSRPPQSSGGPLDNAIRKRNVLMAKIALCTGLRREEVCRLQISSVTAVRAHEKDKALHTVQLTHTKNSVHRKVLFPGRLLAEIQSFASLERAVICKRNQCKGCGVLAPVFPAVRKGKGGHCGAMHPQNFGLVIRTAAKNIGIVRVATKLDVNGKTATSVEVAGFSTHDLRHTYAVWTYLLLRAKGDTNPWLFVQAQLGHRSSETTLNTYLRIVRMFENEISEVFGDLIRALGDLLEGDDQ